MSPEVTALLVLLGLLVVVAAIGGTAIWRMELSRTRASSTKRLKGVVSGKRMEPEHAELRLPFRGVGGPATIVAPDSYLLRIETADGQREVVVQASVYDAYEVGDPFP